MAKFMKAEFSRLVPRILAANLELQLSSVFSMYILISSLYDFFIAAYEQKKCECHTISNYYEKCMTSGGVT